MSVADCSKFAGRQRQSFCLPKLLCLRVCSGDGLRTSVLREFGVGSNDVEVVVPSVLLLTQLPATFRTSHGNVCRRRLPESMTYLGDNTTSSHHSSLQWRRQRRGS